MVVLCWFMVFIFNTTVSLSQCNKYSIISVFIQDYFIYYIIRWMIIKQWSGDDDDDVVNNSKYIYNVCCDRMIGQDK